MCDYTFADLYEHVLYEAVHQFRLTDSEISNAIDDMIEVYKPDPTSSTATKLDVADYNDPAHRCAYLHKCAPIHTALVADMFQKTVFCNIKFLRSIIHNTGLLNICCLGGGPGSDVIGILAVLNSIFGCFEINVTLVDLMIGWRQTFSSVISALQSGRYNYLTDIFSTRFFNYSYEVANLLEHISPEVNYAIESANLITMIKFISASSCKDTSAMIRRIFKTIKPGAMVLYIDNAGGGFHELVRKEAAECNLITVFGPLKHEHYINHSFNVKRFGHTPCLQTKVTVHAWRKSDMQDSFHVNQINYRNLSLEQYSTFSSQPIQISIVNSCAQNTTAVISERTGRKPDKYEHFLVNQFDHWNWYPEEQHTSFPHHQIWTPNHSSNTTAVLSKQVWRKHDMYEQSHVNQIGCSDWSAEEQYLSFPHHQIWTPNHSSYDTTAIISEQVWEKHDKQKQSHVNQIGYSDWSAEEQYLSFHNHQISIDYDNVPQSERKVLFDCPALEEERRLVRFSNSRRFLPKRVNSGGKENAVSRRSRLRANQRLLKQHSMPNLTIKAKITDSYNKLKNKRFNSSCVRYSIYDR